MKLKIFIEKLEEIRKKYGDDKEVVMADSIPVVDPIFSDKYYGGSVVITDRE